MKSYGDLERSKIVLIILVISQLLYIHQLKIKNEAHNLSFKVFAKVMSKQNKMLQEPTN